MCVGRLQGRRKGARWLLTERSRVEGDDPSVQRRVHGGVDHLLLRAAVLLRDGPAAEDDVRLSKDRVSRGGAEQREA